MAANVVQIAIVLESIHRKGHRFKRMTRSIRDAGHNVDRIPPYVGANVEDNIVGPKYLLQHIDCARLVGMAEEQEFPPSILGKMEYKQIAVARSCRDCR